MILVADIGNTSITAGVYQGDKLLANWRLASDKKRSEDLKKHKSPERFNDFVRYLILYGKFHIILFSY